VGLTVRPTLRFRQELVKLGFMNADGHGGRASSSIAGCAP
jgi:hypothetical protein